MKKNFYINPATSLIELRGERLMDPLSPTGTQTPGKPTDKPIGGFGAPGRGMRL